MGKKWDYDVPGVDVWAECLRVLKPGGHLLAFAGTRTQHRMAVRIEDAGFEIRDMIAWVYGSGFPKSLDVSKAIDKCNGDSGRALKFTGWMRQTGLQTAEVRNLLCGAGLITEKSNQASHYFATTMGSQPTVPTAAMWAVIRPHCGDVPTWVDELVQRIEAERDVVGQKTAGIANPDDRDRHTIGGSASVVVNITAPATEAAQQWEGWGTALKPALEPITVARKPLIGTVAENVLEHGTGGLNIDGCRVGIEFGDKGGWRPNCYGKDYQYQNDGEFLADVANGSVGQQHEAGRWPANLIHDGSDEVVAGFPITQTNAGTIAQGNAKGCFGVTGATGTIIQGDKGSAARFFYCAKASRADRNEGMQSGDKPAVGTGATMREREDADWKARNGNHHPTVKPTDLMRYLCRLVTPPGGVVLDPFMGSGSTGKAAMLEGFRFVGIEREAEYLAIARARIEAATTPEPKAEKPAAQTPKPKPATNGQNDLFSEAS
jgi:hypothetical protein